MPSRLWLCMEANSGPLDVTTFRCSRLLCLLVPLIRRLPLTALSAVRVVVVFKGPFVKAELRDFGANSVDSPFLNETTLFTGNFLVMFPVNAMTLGATLLARLLCRNVNYEFA